MAFLICNECGAVVYADSIHGGAVPILGSYTNSYLHRPTVQALYVRCVRCIAEMQDGIERVTPPVVEQLFRVLEGDERMEQIGRVVEVFVLHDDRHLTFTLYVGETQHPKTRIGVRLEFGTLRKGPLRPQYCMCVGELHTPGDEYFKLHLLERVEEKE